MKPPSDVNSISVPIRALVCDGIPLVRDSLAGLLDSQSDFKVVATAESVAQTLLLTRTYRPDVVLLGLDPEPNLQASRRLAEYGSSEESGPHVLVFHHDCTDALLSDLLLAGVKGLLNRDATGEEVLAAVRGVARGSTMLSTVVVDRLVEWFRRVYENAPRAAEMPEVTTLTLRERQVLALVGHGMTIDDVAERLYIGISTVRTHLHRIRHKLALKDRAQLVAFAYRSGLMSEQAVSGENPDYSHA
ncbi:response regulator transcription factor [Streptomyces sp. NPDC088400]|uniref:response regulator transcription factor n=1 Tax=Streptomyces sp. NPDC088400 TaxID=3365861 RepID=UPI003803E7DB